jgi:hypothetical protein
MLCVGPFNFFILYTYNFTAVLLSDRIRIADEFEAHHYTVRFSSSSLLPARLSTLQEQCYHLYFWKIVPRLYLKKWRV